MTYYCEVNMKNSKVICLNCGKFEQYQYNTVKKQILYKEQNIEYESKIEKENAYDRNL